MRKRKEPELPPQEQYKRFREAAKEAGVTEDEKVFENGLKSIARRKLRSDDQKLNNGMFLSQPHS
jgi:hypothetical protein